MHRLLNVTWSGIWIGCEYAVLGVALVLNFRAGRVVNIAVGQVFVFAALLAATLQDDGFDPSVALVAATLAAGAVAGVQDRLLLQRLRRATPATLLLATVGFATLLSGLCVVLFGRDPISGAGIAPDGTTELGPWRTSWHALIFVVATVVTVGIVWLVIARTAAGRAMTAAGHDPGAAAMLGINVGLLRTGAVVTAGVLLGLAGALFLPLGVVDFSLGLRLTLFGFVAAAISGYESVPGALLGGWAFGIIDALGTAYLSSTFGLFFTFSALIVLAFVTQWVRSEREVFETV
jgi:branched-chain amino acid transport system permease protein